MAPAGFTKTVCNSIILSVKHTTDHNGASKPNLNVRNLDV